MARQSKKRKSPMQRATYEYLRGNILDVFPKYKKDAEDHLSKAVKKRKSPMQRATYEYLRGNILDVFPKYKKDAEDHLSKAVKKRKSPMQRATYEYLRGNILDVFPEYKKDAEDHLSKAALLAQICDVPSDQQCLIYKGRILKDDQTLVSYGLQADHTVHIVCGSAPAVS
ncbi:putative Ubiquitin family protein isoform 3 [Forsythia ovata]|uniref:Ubiquitin family protein isoform 3 n=1 Tax=Forsythia ovata TaxID=205694 RepID=A0ABD1NWZ7_9LAMI